MSELKIRNPQLKSLLTNYIDDKKNEIKIFETIDVSKISNRKEMK